MPNYLAGSSWSDTYARRAAPVLVTLAERRKTITYKRLAELLGDAKYTRPLMHALGRLGTALDALSRNEGKKFGRIPPIQLLVCNKRSRRPGNRALGFLGLRPAQTARMSEQQLNALVSGVNQDIFSFADWLGVLKLLGLRPLKLDLPSAESLLPKIEKIERRSTGEGEDHRRFKLFLAQNPGRIGIRWKGQGDTEQSVLSGDRLDISFRDDDNWICVEVKARRSPVPDLVRGIFQCVKYRAVLEAQLKYEVLEGVDRAGRTAPRVLLACEGVLTGELEKLAESLEIEVKSGVSVPRDFLLEAAPNESA